MFKLHPDFISHQVGDERVIVSTGHSTKTFNGIMRGNETTALMIDLLADYTTKEELLNHLKTRYPDAPEAHLQEDLEMVLSKLSEHGALLYDN